jgi:hypothetical protein
MAKFVPADASAISGRRGGIVYSHNRNGYYTRAFVTPVNPRSSSQTVNRNRFGDTAALWRGLSDSQRTGWTVQAQNVNRTDRVGLSYNLTGLQLYNGNNQNRLLVGQARTSDAPAFGTLPGISITSVDLFDDNTVQLNYTAGNTSAARRFLIYATAPVSAGRSFIRSSEYRFVQAILSNAASPASLDAAYTALFGSLSTKVGMKVFFKVVPLDENYYAGPAVETSQIVDAA